MKIFKKLLILILVLAVSGVGWKLYTNRLQNKITSPVQNLTPTPTPEKSPHPMAIESLKKQDYPGGQFTVEQQLANGSNYEQKVVSYQSEGLKIYGLLTIPLSSQPEKGYPAIVFVHGYIPPKQYSTINDYPTYQARLARNGFVTFKPDLRGHGNSEGEPVSAHYSEKYIIDTLNAISYLKDHPQVNPKKIGYWGHSNGAQIGLRVVVISQDVQVASFWAGVVGSYQDMFETYNPQIDFLRDATQSALVKNHGLPSQNPEFWNQIDPFSYLDDIQAPIQIHHGVNDQSVPIELSQSLKNGLEKTGKPVEYYEYPGDDHNISQNVSTAFERTINFYNQSL